MTPADFRSVTWHLLPTQQNQHGLFSPFRFQEVRFVPRVYTPELGDVTLQLVPETELDPLFKQSDQVRYVESRVYRLCTA